MNNLAVAQWFAKNKTPMPPYIGKKGAVRAGYISSHTRYAPGCSIVLSTKANGTAKISLHTMETTATVYLQGWSKLELNKKFDEITSLAKGG